MYKEFNGLVDQGVFSHDWTAQQLKEQGIRGKPVPLSICLTHKWKDGILEKLKTRMCIAGHPGNVTKGIHYTDVFSASPNQHTERLLQAMLVNLHLYVLTWDVKMAYTWAPVEPGERIAVEYPSGFKRFDPNHPNEPLYLILERNLYGMPSAGRGWSKCRNKFILSHFSKAPWAVYQCKMDPCLFIIDKYPEGITPKAIVGQSTMQQPTDDESTMDELSSFRDLDAGVHRSWILIHTDDCDAYGTCDKVLKQINNVMNDEWTTEIVDSSFVLGVKRTLVRDPNGWYLTMTMTSFIDDLVSTFRVELDNKFGKRTVSTPFPENVILTKANKPSEGEVQRNIKRGYQRLVGSLLWCVRHVSPISQYGMSQLCKLMSCPTDFAFDCALHLLKYLELHRTDGIRFSETDDLPFATVDASNKDDPHDGLCQYGYSIHWGGPLISKSSKLSHVGINSSYNEYMALTFCIKQIVWLRQLMNELGLWSYIAKPTMVLADNRQANNLCMEDIVTNGNMYFRTNYHYNKEAVKDKYCTVHYLDTQHNPSDCHTKGLARVKIQTHKPFLHGYDKRIFDLPR